MLINPLGDLIVRPNALEASVRLVPCSGSVQQHLLTSYLRSLLAMLLSQFSAKRLKGGMTGVVHLARDNTALKVRIMGSLYTVDTFFAGRYMLLAKGLAF